MMMQKTHPLPPAVRAGLYAVAVIALILFLLTGIGYLSSQQTAKAEAEVKQAALNKPNDLSTPEGVKNALAAAGMPPDMDFSTKPKETMQRMRACARKSGGDFNKLSVMEQQMFNTVTAGHGAKWLKFLAEHPDY